MNRFRLNNNGAGIIPVETSVGMTPRTPAPSISDEKAAPFRSKPFPRSGARGVSSSAARLLPGKFVTAASEDGFFSGLGKRSTPSPSVDSPPHKPAGSGNTTTTNSIFTNTKTRHGLNVVDADGPLRSATNGKQRSSSSSNENNRGDAGRNGKRGEAPSDFFALSNTNDSSGVGNGSLSKPLALDRITPSHTRPSDGAPVPGASVSSSPPLLSSSGTVAALPFGTDHPRQYRQQQKRSKQHQQRHQHHQQEQHDQHREPPAAGPFRFSPLGGTNKRGRSPTPARSSDRDSNNKNNNHHTNHNDRSSSSSKGNSSNNTVQATQQGGASKTASNVLRHSVANVDSSGQTCTAGTNFSAKGTPASESTAPISPARAAATASPDGRSRGSRIAAAAAGQESTAAPKSESLATMIMTPKHTQPQQPESTMPVPEPLRGAEGAEGGKSKSESNGHGDGNGGCRSDSTDGGRQLDTIAEDQDAFDDLCAEEDSIVATADAGIKKLARRQLSIRESYARSHSRLLQNDMSTKTAADAEDFLAAVRSLLAEMNLESPAMQSDVSVRGKGTAALPPLSTSA